MFNWFRKPGRLVLLGAGLPEEKQWEREITLVVTIAFCDAERGVGTQQEKFRQAERVSGPAAPEPREHDPELAERFAALAQEIEANGFLLMASVTKPKTGEGMVSFPGHRIHSVRFVQGIVGEWRQVQS